VVFTNVTSLKRIAPFGNNKRGARRVRQNKSPVNVISMTPSEAKEMALARRNDTAVCSGRFTGSLSATTSPSVVINMNPSAGISTRLGAFAAIFSKYRIKSILIKFISSGTITGQTGMGLLDDAPLEGDGPTSYSGMLEMRCTAANFNAQTIPTEFEWFPVDKSKWYFTSTGATGSDQRLVIPAILFAACSTGTTNLTYQLDFTYVFAGSIDVGST